MRSCFSVVVFSWLAMLGLFGCGGSSTSSLLGITGTPVISSVSPNPVAPGAALTITGTNLNGTYTTAYFQETGVSSGSAVASAGNTTSVTVTVPTTLSAGTYNLFVITNDGSGDVSTQSNHVSIALN